MKTYTIYETYRFTQVLATPHTVEANSLEEAIEKAQNGESVKGETEQTGMGAEYASEESSWGETIEDAVEGLD